MIFTRFAFFAAGNTQPNSGSRAPPAKLAFSITLAPFFIFLSYLNPARICAASRARTVVGWMDCCACSEGEVQADADDEAGLAPAAANDADDAADDDASCAAYARS